MILNEPNKMSEIHPLQLVTNLKYELILLLRDNSKMDRVMNNDSIDLYPMRKHFKKVMRRVRRKIQWRCLRVMNNLARVVATRDEMETFLFCCNVKDTSVPSVAKYSPFHYACTKKYAMLATEMLRYNTRDEMLPNRAIYFARLIKNGVGIHKSQWLFMIFRYARARARIFFSLLFRVTHCSK